jgi:uncharacterized membrane protein
MSADVTRQVCPPRWLAPTTLVLAVIGIGVASYLTAEHFSGSNTLAGCHAGGLVNCTKVTTSAESHILGIPVALLGLVYFVLAVPFLLPVAWRSPDVRIRVFRQLGAIAGLGFVLWLVFAEFVKIHNICEYCTGVHIITLILFVVISYGTLVTAPTTVWDEGDDTDDTDVPAARSAAQGQAKV